MGLHAALYEPRRGGYPVLHAALYEPRRGGNPRHGREGRRSGSTCRPLRTEARRKSRTWERGEEIRLYTPPSTDRGGEEIRFYTPPSTDRGEEEIQGIGERGRHCDSLSTRRPLHPDSPGNLRDFEFSIAANIFVTGASACNMTPSLLVSATYPECFDRSL